MERFVYGITLKSKTGLLCRAALATAKGAPRNDGPSVALRRMMRLWAIFMKFEGSSTCVDTYDAFSWHDKILALSLSGIRVIRERFPLQTFCSMNLPH